jgi:hypothetical protein
VVEVRTRIDTPFAFDIANTTNSFSIIHGPTPKERELMQEWIDILIAFAHNDQSYDFGMKAIDEFKTVTAGDTISIEKDTRWETLLKLSDVFATG